MTRVVVVLIAWLAGMGSVRADVGFGLPPVRDDILRGVGIGEFVLVPMVGVSAAYHSNLFREDVSEGPSAATIVSVRPGLRLFNPDPSWVRLSWAAAGGFHWYFSDDPKAREQGRYSAESTLRADFLPRSMVGFFVQDTFLRDVQPRNDSSSATYDRNFNHAEAGIQIRPGGGALEIALSYAFNFDLFDSFSAADLFYHEGRLLATWDFLPKTAVFLDANLRFLNWRNRLDGMREDSMPLRAVAGVRGFVTRKISLMAKAGYAQGFLKAGSDYKTGVGEASVAFMPTAFTVIDLGYARSVEDSYYGRYFTDDHVHLSVQQQFARRVNITLWGAYSRLTFGAYTPPAGGDVTVNQTRRKDDVVRARAVVDFSIVRFVSVQLGYQMDANLTRFRITEGGAVDRGRFLVHQAFGGVRLFY